MCVFFKKNTDKEFRANFNYNVCVRKTDRENVENDNN